MRKPRTRRASIAAVLLGLLLLFPGIAQAATVHTEQEVELLRLLNEYRQSKGVGALLMSDLLCDAAEKHNKDMANHDFFDHTTKGSDYFPAGSRPRDRMAACGYGYQTVVGENLAAGNDYLQPAAVLAAWKTSASHNAIILDSSLKVVGISLDGVWGSKYGYYWTTDFGGFIDPTSDNPSNTRALGGPFPDVAPTDPYAAAIRALSQAGIITGYADGTFGPRKMVWRQHFAKMVVSVLDLPVSEADVAYFSDVVVGGPETLYPDNYIAVAAAEGITVGTGGGRFSPASDVTRAQAVTMMVRALERLEPGALEPPPAGFRSVWADQLAYPHAEAARLADANGLLAGLSVRSLDPWGTITRGEIAQTLFNLENLLAQ